MELIKASDVMNACAGLLTLQIAVEDQSGRKDSGILDDLERTHNLCERLGLTDLAMRSARLSHKAKHAFGQVLTRDAIEKRAEISILSVDLYEDLRLSLERRSFMYIAPDRVDLMDADQLFGPGVNAAFPSAARDIREAGNALATESSTACVFHLMRAAEVALRVLATDRGISYPDASLEVKQVGDLLGALDGKMNDLRKADTKKWPSRDVKDAQIRFYHEAIVEFRDFNEAWRKHMAHAHANSFYDRDYAFSIMRHVRHLMENLARRISEDTQTPEYWTQA